jgi:hypothetical protein
MTSFACAVVLGVAVCVGYTEVLNIKRSPLQAHIDSEK